MINSSVPRDPSTSSEDEAVDRIVRGGPGGAVVVASIATAIVVALWFAFYFFVFLPRVAAP